MRLKNWLSMGYAGLSLTAACFIVPVAGMALAIFLQWEQVPLPGGLSDYTGGILHAMAARWWLARPRAFLRFADACRIWRRAFAR